MTDFRSENGDAQAAEEDRTRAAGTLPQGSSETGTGAAQPQAESSRLSPGRRVPGP